jgi:Tol biopolymer transport system component
VAERRTTAALLAAVAVVVAVTAAVVGFGIRRLPSFPAVSDAPALDVPGTIAYLASDDDGDACVTVVAAAGGAPRSVLCADDATAVEWISEVAWSPDGRLLVHGNGEFGDEVVLVVDMSTGAVLERILLARPEDGLVAPFGAVGEVRTRPDGAEVLVAGAYDEGEAKLAVRDGAGATRTILTVDGPRDYGFTDAVWSPGGEWILVQDSDGRLLVVAADGKPDPRLLLDRGEHGPRYPEPGGVAWYVPGDPTYTVDPALLPG